MSRSCSESTRIEGMGYDGPDRVYIGRPSKWGNPFVIGPDGTRSEVIESYRSWIVRQEGLVGSLEELRGKVLCCHCKPAPCHGDVLRELLGPDPEGGLMGLFLDPS